ncbi:MAG: EipA family protein [Asticcacaulis sp.]
MERRQFMLNGLAAGAAMGASAVLPSLARANTGDAAYHRDEIVRAGSDFLGVTAEALGGAIEKIFMDYGDSPTAYIAGEEVSGAIGVGLRYGKGLVHMKSLQAPTPVFWQGPSAGFDGGVNASRVFTLAYFLESPDQIFRRFPGVEGSAYFVGGLGVNYQRAEGMVLAPIRAGVGFRLGANVGWLAYSRKRNILPF